jgi:hypothetical protein
VTLLAYFRDRAGERLSIEALGRALYLAKRVWPRLQTVQLIEKRGSLRQFGLEMAHLVLQLADAGLEVADQRLRLVVSLMRHLLSGSVLAHVRRSVSTHLVTPLVTGYALSVTDGYVTRYVQ